MEPLRIFVASSSEGEPIARELRSLLQAELGNSALVELWMHKFALGETAIESLETVANEVDFAVVVMTPDDVTVSRHKKKVAPRDNLVFELGLFIGALGRERSIVARDGKDGLKLPSDILGVTALTYNAASSGDLTTSLQTACVKLAGQLKGRGLRPKWLAEGRAALATNAHFCCQVEGAWWERINHPEGSAVSFFTIIADPLSGNVVLEGESYGGDGEQCAKWKSEMTRLYPTDRRIAYLWRGKHPLPGFAHLDFHGYGTMEFKPPEESSHQTTKGSGDFWDVDEAQPGKTMFKPVELRRVLDERHRHIMTSGSARQKHDLVLRVIATW